MSGPVIRGYREGSFAQRHTGAVPSSQGRARGCTLVALQKPRGGGARLLVLGALRPARGPGDSRPASTMAM